MSGAADAFIATYWPYWPYWAYWAYSTTACLTGAPHRCVSSATAAGATKGDSIGVYLWHTLYMYRVIPALLRKCQAMGRHATLWLPWIEALASRDGEILRLQPIGVDGVLGVITFFVITKNVTTKNVKIYRGVGHSRLRRCVSSAAMRLSQPIGPIGLIGLIHPPLSQKFKK